jgi:hypothetical protein
VVDDVSLIVQSLLFFDRRLFLFLFLQAFAPCSSGALSSPAS